MFWVQPPAGSPYHFSPDGPGSDGRLFPLPTSKGTFSVERSPINPPPSAGHSLTSNGDPTFLSISIFGSRNVLWESQELLPEWRGKSHSVNHVPQYTPPGDPAHPNQDEQGGDRGGECLSVPADCLVDDV